MALTKTGRKATEKYQLEGLLGVGAAVGAGTGVSALAEKVLQRGNLTEQEAGDLIAALKRAAKYDNEVVWRLSDTPMAMPAKYYQAMPRRLQKLLLETPELKPLERGADILFTNRNAGAAAHEFGHIANKLSNSKALSRLLLYTKPWSAISPWAAVPAGMMAASGVSKKDGEDELLRKAVTYGPAVLAAPTLVDETAASVKGFNLLRKTRGLRYALKGLPMMGAGLATYGTLAALPILAGVAGEHFASKSQKGSTT